LLCGDSHEKRHGITMDDVERNKIMAETDACLGEYDGNGEFDCGYEHAVDLSCEDCMHGPKGVVAGTYNPDTGKKIIGKKHEA